MPDAGPNGGLPRLFPLTVQGLVFEAAGQRLIDDLHLVLEKGPRTLILGPNGAGKSLLLRLLHGLLPPAAGELRWGDCPVGSARTRQAMVFQRPVLLRRSAAANLRHALHHRGLRGDVLHGRVETWLRRAGLLEQAARPARLLSAGEQQRLAVARALSCAPEVLFLDEPTANLDPTSTLEIERLILQAHEEGVSIIMVTHDLGQARRLGGRILFLNRGRIEEQAPCAAFFAGPSSEQARDFLAGRLVL